MKMRKLLLPASALTLALFLIAGRSLLAQDTVPSPEPSAVAEDEVARESRQLFEDGVETFAARKFTSAVPYFQKLLSLYPSSSYRLDALFYLGQSYFHAGKFAEATPPLQSTIEAAGRSPTANEARVVLGNTYLELQKFSEAFLVSEELLKQSDLRTTLRGKALLIRAQAQAGMKQPLESEKTFTVFQAVADQDPELERELARSYLFSLLVKGGECEKLASTPLPEDALLEQMNRKGVCLLEMGSLLSRSARTLTSDEIRDGSDQILKAYRNYSAACLNPPLRKGSRTEKQLTIARAELAHQLKDSCRNTHELLLESLRDRESATGVSVSLKGQRPRPSPSFQTEQAPIPEVADPASAPDEVPALPSPSPSPVEKTPTNSPTPSAVPTEPKDT